LKATPADQNKWKIILGLEDKDIMEKTDEYIEKRMKNYERNMQELYNSIKRPNLQIMDIEGGEEVQVKGTGNIFSKIITENFPYLEKEVPIQVQEASRTQNRHDQNKTSTQYSIDKTISTENKERILKAGRKKHQLTCKGKSIKKK
jgi:hypothetical protein